MNQQERATTNERLYCCRLQIDWYAQKIAEASLPTRILEMACGEGLRVQLITAYQAYLAELSAAYNGPSTNFKTAIELSDTSIHCAELNELLVLEQGDSWLSRLLNHIALQQVSGLSLPARGGDISLFQASDGEAGLAIESLNNCYLSLKQLIDIQRSHSEEW